jgi:alanine racemase
MNSLSYIEINKKNIVHNFKQFRNYVNPKTKIISVVKANAYGHGLAQVVQILDQYTDYFAVDDIEELDILRKYSTKPTLVMGYVQKKQLEEVILLNGIPVIYDIERARILNEIGDRQNRKIKIHIKFDAELGRQGLLLNQVKQFVIELKTLPKIQPEAMYAHFANIEDLQDPAQLSFLEHTHAQKQIDLHKEAIKILKKNGYKDIKTHISSTAGTIVYEKNEHHNDFVRIGIGLYGMWPSEPVRQQFESKGIDLRPVLKWVTHVAQVKEVEPNFPIAYGLTHITKNKTKIAIIPQGYSDGWSRGLSNRGEVLIRGERCKVLGRIMMNMFVVDVTHLPKIASEDTVILLGDQDTQRITAEEIASKLTFEGDSGSRLSSINYEITTNISQNLQRIIV